MTNYLLVNTELFSVLLIVMTFLLFFLTLSILNLTKEQGYIPALSLSKKSGWSWAFSDRYGRVGKGDARCWNAGKWIEIW